MTQRLPPHAGRPASTAVGALLAGLVGAAPAQDCTPVQWALAPGAEDSRWQEHDAAGRRLLQERGTLATLDLQAATRCVGTDWQATLAVARGRRDYDGRSTTGVPLQTRSDVARQTVRLQALRPLGADWATGLWLGHRWLQRSLQGVGAVQGYDERFATWQAAAGVVHRGSAPALGRAPLAWQAGLWLGGGPPGRMHLLLPQTDAATLRLGASRLVQLHLGLCAAGNVDGAVAPGCSTAAASRWRVDLVWQQEQADAGPAAPLRRLGVLVGGAAQPATRQRALGLQAVLAW